MGITYWIGGTVVRDKVIGVENVDELPESEVTLGEAFRDGGYATYFVGKWHQGDARPNVHGYETVRAWHKGNVGRYFWQEYADRLPDLKKGGEPGEFLTDRLAREVCDLIEDAAREKKPFLMFFSTYAVHTRIATKSTYQKKYERKLETLPPVDGPRLADEADNPNTPMLQVQDTVAGHGIRWHGAIRGRGCGQGARQA